ncbi:hypothetical protein FB45DRAFT_940244 [Roridomyces roridus]|uniref:F-box domain-containing protein n=1 Tax=Roridomyces roridus TaxID=1738132 RepID=A0AAD7FDE3_9AGAR|nr:hypothetical protein FB45DRAFT_940244 [Roridomyces roridus]
MSGISKAPLDLRVPDELWLDIFLYLPREDLAPLHAVSRTFHRIVWPFLFATFAFHPYALGSSLAFDYLLPNEMQIKRALRRLRFWASDEIAPLVQRCAVSPWRRSGNVEYTPCRDGSMILHNFFQQLPRLKNVQALSFLRVEFDEMHLAALASLRPLRELEVAGCRILTSNLSAPLNLIKVTKFQFGIDSLVSEDRHQWLRVLNRQTLSHLMLGDDPSASMNYAMRLLTRMPFTFPNVHTLTISVRRLEELAYLTKFPGVRCLSVEPIHAPVRHPNLQPIALPDLESYQGPPEGLHLLGPTTRPTKLKIVARAHPRFLDATAVLPHAHLITSLALQMDYLPTGVFRSLFSSFISLAELDLLFGHPDNNYVPNMSAMYTDQTLFMDLSIPPTPFPTTLSTLSISWRIYSGTPAEEVIAAARAARSALVSAHSNLRKIELSSYAMRYQWKKNLDGQLGTERVVSGPVLSGVRAWFWE